MNTFPWVNDLPLLLELLPHRDVQGQGNSLPDYMDRHSSNDTFGRPWTIYRSDL